MNRIRVLIVDDSVVIRSVLRQLISAEPDMEVAGVAANGKIALDLLDRVSADLVTLDIEMPELDGLQTLAVLRKTRPRLPVIMFSTLTERGAVSTLQALALGASDYVTKPSNARPGDGLHSIREQLLSKVRALCRTEHLVCPTAAIPVRSCPSGAPIAAIAIGASTGGPNALSQVLPLLPASLAVPVFVVQHMPPMFTRFLAERLHRECKLPVREVKDGDIVKPGTVWIAAGDYHMILEKETGQVRLRTTQSPPENSCRPSVDVLFRSAARVYGAGLLAVVLTGMGQDGLRGCQAIRERGGTILAQDEASSVVWGMPGYVANAGLADRVLPLAQIASEINRRVAARALQPLET
jgi:two-component system chemotaxis response regulator CheB